MVFDKKTKSLPHIEDDGAIYWIDNKGLYHRIDGPAVIYADGTEWWYVENNLHRIDGPAIIYADGTRKWFQYGKRHRIDGPAIEHADGSKSWWIDGIQQQQFCSK